MSRVVSPRGFTLVELVMTTALLCALTGTLFAVLQPARDFFAVQPEIQDEQQRLRFAVETVGRDIEMAGVPVVPSSGSFPVRRAFAAVMPYRIGDRRADPPAGVFYRPDVITLIVAAPQAIPARIRSQSVSGTSASVDVEPNCQRSTTGVCGFSDGTRVAAFDECGRVWFGTVTGTDGHVIVIGSTSIDSHLDPAKGAFLSAVEITTYSRGVDAASGVARLMKYDGHVTDLPVVDDIVNLSFEYAGDPRPPVVVADAAAAGVVSASYGPPPPAPGVDDPADAWPVGENCTFAAVDGRHVPRLPVLDAGLAPVVLAPATLTDGPWCPDPGSPNRFDADLLRIRRVQVVVRVQVAYPWLRGTGPLFTNQGTGRAATRLVPDQEIRFAVSPRAWRRSWGP